MYVLRKTGKMYLAMKLHRTQKKKRFMVDELFDIMGLVVLTENLKYA